MKTEEAAGATLQPQQSECGTLTTLSGTRRERRFLTVRLRLAEFARSAVGMN